jgi:outer membrane protein OmpA-like peptidoglycan-associated protein
MNSPRFFPLTLIALAVVAGCSTTPAPNARLDEARNNYRMAQDDPQTRDMAGAEMRQASDALNKANDAWTRNENPTEVDHLAYLTRQKVLIAQEAARRKTAELAVTQADAARDKLRLEARTNEADTAQRSAAASQQQSEASQRQAASAQRQAVASQGQADASRQQAEAAKQQASDAQARSSQLEAQLRDLNAKKTDRGLVVTLGDVLFDTNQAQLKSGGLRSVQKLGTFLAQYPQRRALVEGFTDNTGSEGLNQELSGRRADAVRAALVSLGVSGDRIATHGYGEAYPVAGNDSAGGRQMNRRVEIVLSAEDGSIAPR